MILLPGYGCAANGAYRPQTEAAERKGRADAGFEPPPLVGVCSRERPHADLKDGEELSTLAALEGDVVNALNKDKRDCAYLERKWREDLR